MKAKIIAGVLLAAVLAVCGAVVLNLWDNYDEFYYTQVDNSRIKALQTKSSDDMGFEYTLDCFDEKGGRRELKFKTVRELREDAFLKLEVRIAGVYSWEEVELGAIPEKAREKLE